MATTLWQGLLGNLGIIAIFISAWAYSAERTRPLPKRLQCMGVALTAGGCSIILMLLPFQIQPGVQFDLRPVPIVLAGFLSGPLAGLATGVIAALFRIYLGGVAVPAALVSIATTTLVGVVGHALLHGRPVTPRAMTYLAVAAAPGALWSVLLLPGAVLRNIPLEVILVEALLIVAALLMAGGAIMAGRRRRDIARENQIYRAVIEALPEPLNAKDPEGRFVAVNPATAELMQAPDAAALIGKTDFDFYPPATAANFRRDEETVMASRSSKIIEQRVERRDGSSMWLSTVKAPLFDRAGESLGLVTHNRDITGRKRLEEEHEANRRLLAEALAGMADALVMYDREDRLVMCNQRYREMFAKTAHLRVPGARFRDILRASIETGEQGGVAPEDVEAWIDKTCASLHVAGETNIQLGDGRWFHTRVRPTPDGGSLSVISDVTSTRLAEEKLAELNRRLTALARLDGLTGLVNRRGFEETLVKEFGRSTRTGMPLSLVLIDVDHFKAFNDTYGHPAGDACLKAIARTLEASLRRPGDVAARYGGEELVAILPRTDAQGAEELGEAIRIAIRNLAIPHTATAPGVVSVSIGVATRAGHGDGQPEEFVRRADKALYAAKAAGRDRVVADRPHLVRPARSSPEEPVDAMPAGGGPASGARRIAGPSH
ncbi:MAG TPA: diguanylate cyclase [Bauldia sp.]|nr:diguanylate cyclase [Bauldia sp.]